MSTVLAAHVLPTYPRADVTFVAGEGAWLVDKNGLLRTLELPEHVGHRRVGEHQVVDTGWTRRIGVETTEEIVEIVCAPAPGDQREIRWRDAETALRVVGPYP